MVNFGSSIQYLNSLSDLNNVNFKNVSAVLITHTPISISKKYISKQENSKNLYQNIHSIKDVIKFFKKKKFNLEFKSRNEDKYISAKKKYKTFSLNMLFLR